ncbi:MAG: response regulator [Gammaproteobacteria bacterium]|nr:response regulator [Gammaproteobacteria bacterium]
MTITPKKPVKILIVNDSQVLTAVIRATVETHANYKVVATALNGIEAISQVKRHLPDLVLMDIHMPKMNGVEATHQIIRNCPKTRILITSATIPRNMRHIFEALHHGATDYVRSPCLPFAPGTHVTEQQLLQAGKALLHKIHAVLGISDKKLLKQNRPQPPSTQPAPQSAKSKQDKPLSLLAIGCSTGGPTTVVRVLKNLRHPFPTPIIICLHLDAEFTQGFVSWLSDQTHFPCSIARHQERLENGRIYIAPGGKHNLGVGPGLQFLISAPEPKQYFFPNINHLFSSIAKNVSGKSCGVVLTGMGDDGASGLKEMLQTGAIALAQDEQSAIIDAMPRAARLATNQEQGYPPEHLATKINSHL